MKNLIFQVILSLGCVLVLTEHSAAQQPLTSESKMAQTAQTKEKEFSERKKRLLQSKKEDQWAPAGGGYTPGQFVMELTVSECTWLGGTVVHWPHCGGTNMKCIGPSGREMCIDEIK